MSDKEIKVLEIHKTSLGLVLVFQFSSGTTPKLGMLLEDRNGNQWKIISYGMNKKFHLIDRFVKAEIADYCWDCIVDPSPAKKIRVGDLLQIVL